MISTIVVRKSNMTASSASRTIISSSRRRIVASTATNTIIGRRRALLNNNNNHNKWNNNKTIHDYYSKNGYYYNSLSTLLTNSYYTTTTTTRTTKNANQQQQQQQRMYEIPFMPVVRSILRDEKNQTLCNRSSLNRGGLPRSSSSCYYNNNYYYHSKSYDYSSVRIPRLHQQQQISCFSTDLKPKQQEPDSNNEQQQPSVIDNTTNNNNNNQNNQSKQQQQQQRVNPAISRKLSTTQVPTPASALPPTQTMNPLETLKQTTPKSVIRKGMDVTISIFHTVLTFLFQFPGNTWYYITHPKERYDKIDSIRDTIREEIHHYWNGTKLLWADIQTSRNLLRKTLHGSSLTRRERRQLLRTVSDLFRLIPFSMFVIIPFMEFALPFALKIFPNLLPSTYQGSLKAEEDMKRELKTRIAMAQFFQETLEDLAKEQKRKASQRKEELEQAGVAEVGDISQQKDSAASMLEFLNKARRGEMVSSDVIIRYAKYFQDDLTLDNMPRMQLINMCRYMGIPPYGNDNFLRFQLRMKIRSLKEDDQRILWEGIDSLTKMELREAVRERGMRSTGLSKESYKRNLQQWLDLSVNKDVPISLLIMSRTFFLQEDEMLKPDDDGAQSLAGLADAISGLDKGTVNEVILQVATAEEKISDKDVRKIKLEVLSQQNHLIKEEEKEKAKKAAAKKIEAAEKEKIEIFSKEELPVTLPISETPDIVTATSAAPATPSSSMKIDTNSEPEKVILVEKEGKIEKESTLSAEEMDAISQLVVQDPVSLERAELEKIKAAMKIEEVKKPPKVETGKISEDVISEKVSLETIVPDATLTASKPTQTPMTPDEADQFVRDTIAKMDQQTAKMQTESALKVSVSPEERILDSTDIAAAASGEKEDIIHEDPVVARLKKRVESMVDKIEVQLSETEVKIGDKLHFLDKDNDGILTQEEMAGVLQSVLKRKLSAEEAMDITATMDTNKDGVFTVAELRRWIDENKMVRYFEEGRDADLQWIIDKASTSPPKTEETVEITPPTTSTSEKSSTS